MLGAKDTYEFLRDMSLLLATGGVALITNVFATFCKLSATIDNMRSVYRNVGATSDMDGLYPAPLHDVRRALQTLDPRKHPAANAAARALVRDAILQAFYALRETFLEEPRSRGAGSPAADLGRAPRQVVGPAAAARRRQER